MTRLDQLEGSVKGGVVEGLREKMIGTEASRIVGLEVASGT